MSFAIPLATLAQSFRPLEVASYLRLHGWTQQEQAADRFSIWTRTDQKRGEFEVFLPMQPNYSDYLRRVKKLVETLEAFEGRPQTEILEDLSTPNADLVRARLAPGRDFDGTLPLADGASAFQQMRDLMLAAACAAVAPKGVYAKRKPDQAMKYLRDARIGQTQRGSYVITVVSRSTWYRILVLVGAFSRCAARRQKRNFQADSMPYLEEASRFFRQTGELEGVEVFGAIHRLQHLNGNAGDVTIVGTADGERRTVVAELHGQSHHLAIRAYKEALPVRCVGEIVKEGKSYRLRNPRDFRLLDESS